MYSFDGHEFLCNLKVKKFDSHLIRKVLNSLTEFQDF
jgi:hypothetical protein